MITVRRMVVLALWISAIAFDTSAEAATLTFCYSRAKYDIDLDGYADLGGLKADDGQFVVYGDCPKTTVQKAGDCDDRDANVHSRRPETGFNGVNDNCRESVHESERVCQRT